MLQPEDDDDDDDKELPMSISIVHLMKTLIEKCATILSNILFFIFSLLLNIFHFIYITQRDVGKIYF